MSGLDLNLEPDDVDMEDAGINGSDPFFCTQAAQTEVVDESQDPLLAEHGGQGGDSDVHSGGGQQFNAAPPPANPSTENINTTTMPTTTLSGSSNPELADHGADGVAPNEEVASSPKEPFLGMRFDTIEDAREHYNAYSKRLGFSIKSNTSLRQPFTKVVRKQQFVCNKYRAPKTEEQIQEERVKIVEEVSPVQLDDEDGDGEEAGPSKKPKSAGVKRQREKIKQTKCPAKMCVKLINNKYEVTYFIAEHNHPMLVKPSLTKYLRSHKGIPRDEREFLKCLHDCNLETGRMMTVMSSFYGEECFVPYDPKAITNLRTSLRKEEKEWDIASRQVAYFCELKDKDPFNMPFAPFVGINRHGQSFMLSCGFLRDEKEESFTWLFTQFLDAMHGLQPTNIITDQDKAMRNAIREVFFNTVHRNCRWHVMKKANEKLGPFLGRHPGLAEDFNECINESMSEDEFEARWAEMIAKWDLAEHETFLWLKKYAKFWVPCYYRHRFFPFLQSTQRSEGFNAVLKRYINPHNSIKHFVKQYEKLQQQILGKEGHNDFRTDELEPDPWSPFPIEKQALAVYTRPIYHRFRKEFTLIGCYNVQPQGNNLYQLVPNNEKCYPYGGRYYMVNANGGQFNCECCKFERDDQYILRRWTPAALETVVQPTVPAQDDVMTEESRQKLRFANLSTKFAALAKLSSASDQHDAIARRHIREMTTEFAQLNKDIYFSTYYASENIFRAYPNATSTSTYNIKQAAGTSVSSRACANNTYYM
nr:protein FAR1-RELATED SEQUENCE 12-like [Lolium perenne]